MLVRLAKRRYPLEQAEVGAAGSCRLMMVVQRLDQISVGAESVGLLYPITCQYLMYQAQAYTRITCQLGVEFG